MVIVLLLDASYPRELWAGGVSDVGYGTHTDVSHKALNKIKCYALKDVP